MAIHRIDDEWSGWDVSNTALGIGVGGTAWQIFNVDFTFDEVWILTATYATTTSDLTVELRQGTSTVGLGTLIASKDYNDIPDNSWTVLSLGTPQPAGGYQICVRNRSGQIAIWYDNTTNGTGLTYDPPSGSNQHPRGTARYHVYKQGAAASGTFTFTGEAVGATTTPYTNEVRADNPFGYWKLDDTTTASIADSSSTPHTGHWIVAPTIQQDPLVTSESGKSAHFDGSSTMRGYASAFSGSTDLFNTATLTLEAVVRIENTDWSQPRLIMARHDDGQSPTHHGTTINSFFQWRLSAVDQGVGGVMNFIRLGSPTISVLGNTVIQPGQTYHLAVTFDNATNTCKMYVNGVLDHSESISAGLPTTGSYDLSFASWTLNSATDPARWHGYLDNLAYYKTVLSPERIAAHAAQVAGVPSGDASGTFTFTGDASGEATHEGGAEGGFSFAGEASGSVTCEGDATGAFAWTGDAQGSATHGGAAIGSMAWTGEATGSTVHAGTATGSVTWTGAANGESATPGAATGSFAWTGEATGSVEHTGTATGAFAWAGEASGSTEHEGSAEGAWTFTGEAQGETVHEGTATGASTWAGHARGTTPPVPGSGGSASGSWSSAGEATGSASYEGAATGAFTWSALVEGVTEHLGVAAGAVEWVGAGEGSTIHQGDSEGGAFTWTGEASGDAPPLRGGATGSYSWTGHASGETAHSGEAVAAFVWTGEASGRHESEGSAVGEFAWVLTLPVRNITATATLLPDAWAASTVAATRSAVVVDARWSAGVEAGTRTASIEEPTWNASLEDA